MRGKKIIASTVLSFAEKLIGLLCGFIVRRVFIEYMSEELLGVSSLFSDVLEFLNLAELGLGVAVQFHLYKPIAEKDERRIASIVNLSQRVFSLIGIGVFCSGAVLMFFIQHLIKDNPFSLSFLRWVFMLHVASTASGYFWTHKRLYLQAAEEMYIIKTVDCVITIVMNILRILAIVLCQNYFVYLVLNIIQSLAVNIVVNVGCRKLHPFLQKYKGYDKEDTKLLFSSLKDVVPQKLALYIYSCTDNIIISSVLGLTTVARYGNYMLLLRSIFSFFTRFVDVLKASFGNLICEGAERDTLRRYFDQYYMLQFFVSSFCSVSFLCLLDPFISLWLGSEYLLPSICVFLLVLEFFIHSMYQPLSMMFAATGKFKEDKKITILIAFLNLTISLLLVNMIGLAGVIIGTIVADVGSLLFRSYKICYQFLQIKIGTTLKEFGLYLFIWGGEAWISWRLCDTIATPSKLLNFAIMCIICVIVPNGVNIILFGRTEQFGALADRVKRIVRKRG